MTKEKLIERLKSKAWASHPRGTKDAIYLDDAIDLIEELFEQNCIKHVVSGKRPCTCVEQVTQQMVNDLIEWAKNYPAACASGAVDKTVSGGTECEHPYYSVYGDLDTCLKCGKVLGG